MNRKLTARLAGFVGASALALGGVVVAAPAAQADGAGCANYLAQVPNSRSTTDGNLACGLGAAGLPVSDELCELVLGNVSQVNGTATDTACKQAKQ
ncbi:hypothetical protein [Streptomyces sp. NPDC046261]|uniref:hypothetical protein n=1 Tax=Streptomyces sp. NPDC046261 TaxID=3157200 RepID=UPI0033C8541A